MESDGDKQLTDPYQDSHSTIEDESEDEDADIDLFNVDLLATDCLLTCDVDLSGMAFISSPRCTSTSLNVNEKTWDIQAQTIERVISYMEAYQLWNCLPGSISEFLFDNACQRNRLNISTFIQEKSISKRLEKVGIESLSAALSSIIETACSKIDYFSSRSAVETNLISLIHLHTGLARSELYRLYYCSTRINEKYQSVLTFPVQQLVIEAEDVDTSRMRPEYTSMVASMYGKRCSLFHVKLLHAMIARSMHSTICDIVVSLSKCTDEDCMLSIIHDPLVLYFVLSYSCMMR